MEMPLKNGANINYGIPSKSDLGEGLRITTSDGKCIAGLAGQVCMVNSMMMTMRRTREKGEGGGDKKLWHLSGGRRPHRIRTAT